MLTVKKICIVLFIILSIFTAILPLIYAEDSVPGTSSEEFNPLELVNLSSISPVITETGKISLSIDGLGVYPENTGTIQVEKPAGATVRKAYLAAATIYSGGEIPDGGVQIDGVGVNWDTVISNSINSKNHWADVTSFVKPKIDASPAGRVDFTITEVYDTYRNDGEIFAVIFDDPNQLVDNTVVLLFGAQKTTGDTFSIGLADPIDKSDPNLVLDFSLGISYSYQLGDYQYSIVTVNGDLMTSWAGGEDDGGSSNGKLITVGGLDDSNANPPDPNAKPYGNYRYDDELYNLLPFVSNGDTSINVDTLNPSNNDNVFFAALFLGSTTAVVNEGILLSPSSATNNIGTQHTVKAKMQDDAGNPVVGRDITVKILSGPHAGFENTSKTDSKGEKYFVYTGSSVGIDVIEASAIDSKGNPIASNRVTKEWVAITAPATIESCDDIGNTKDKFTLADDVYVKGDGYSPSTTYDIYVVADVSTWTDGMPIPSRVAGTVTTVTSTSGGLVTTTLIWDSPVIGKYDIVVDVLENGVYDEGIDALDDSDIEVTAGFFIIPELPFGTLMGLATCLAALGVLKSKRLSLKY